MAFVTIWLTDLLPRLKKYDKNKQQKNCAPIKNQTTFWILLGC